MKTTLSKQQLDGPLSRLQSANLAFSRRYPGEGEKRQPVHTVYGGAHLFAADSAQKLGVLALRALDTYAPDCVSFARAIGLQGSDRLPTAPAEAAALCARLLSKPPANPPDKAANAPAWLAHTIYERVREKLRREPVEDFRIDFEDGYGNRPDAEEDGHAVSAAGEVARGFVENTLPPFIGLRIKPFTEELRARSMRTLDLFLTALLRGTDGRLPQNFTITLPKVTVPEQVAVLADLCDLFEARLGLSSGALRFEVMIETPQSILDAQGRSTVPLIVDAARGRCSAAHLGTYDYTAGCNITAAYQTMDHPACDFAKHVMQVCLAGTGVWLSDGATNVMPVGPHRAAPGGPPLTGQQVLENQAAVHGAWRLHCRHIRHSLVQGYYQGWDLHPAQLPTRYASVFAFFLEGLDAASERLKNFVEKAAQATLVGDVFDDAATGQGLLNFFLRGLSCGAIREDEALAAGLSLDELRTRSFLKILHGRRK